MPVDFNLVEKTENVVKELEGDLLKLGKEQVKKSKQFSQYQKLTNEKRTLKESFKKYNNSNSNYSNMTKNKNISSKKIQQQPWYKQHKQLKQQKPRYENNSWKNHICFQDKCETAKIIPAIMNENILARRRWGKNYQRHQVKNLFKNLQKGKK